MDAPPSKRLRPHSLTIYIDKTLFQQFAMPRDISPLSELSTSLLFTNGGAISVSRIHAIWRWRLASCSSSPSGRFSSSNLLLPILTYELVHTNRAGLVYRHEHRLAALLVE
jgi:hypothetical protein